MIRVLLVDDHAILRQGVRELLAAAGDVEVVGEAGTAGEAIAAAQTLRPDVVLLDVALPDRNGIEVIGDLRAAHPRTAVVALSMYPEAQYAVSAVRAGAAGYLPKASDSSEVLAAVRQVATGGRHITPVLATLLAETVDQHHESDPAATLSVRERQVLELLAAGQTATEIGQSLGISVKTVSTYRARLLTKLDLSSTAALIRYAVEKGMAG